MPVFTLSDPTDVRLAPYREIRAEKQWRAFDWFIVEGAFSLQRLLGSHFVIDSILLIPSQYEVFAQQIEQRNTDVYVASAELLREVTGFDFHRGCLAIARRPTTLSEVAFAPLAQKRKSLVVFAEAVSDPSNVGALVRNCRAFGVDHLVLSADCGDPFSRRAIRVSMGNVFEVPITLTGEFTEAVECYRRQMPAGTLLAAALEPDAVLLGQQMKVEHLGLVVGSEGFGLSKTVLALADRKVVIPMAPGADSLNVAAATAVLLYALSNG